MTRALVAAAWGLPALAGPLGIVSVDRTALAIDEYPGQQLVTVRFVNDSDEPDPAAWVLLPVPAGFEVVEGSIVGPGAVAALSPDGGDTFLPEADWDFRNPGRATHVRWQFPGGIDPGVSGIVSFRLRPESVADE
jgi:hypothetical protein